MFDHGRAFDLLAPLLAARFRVIAIDARGHGESEWCDSYPWITIVLDIVHVLRALDRPACLVGHSMGGGLAIDAALLAPDLVRQLVVVDGFGPPPEGFVVPGVSEDRRSTPERLAAFLDARRDAGTAAGVSRVYPSLDALAERRRSQNPRLTLAWLRYFVFHGARRTARGWVWKADLRAARGFSPWKAEWLGPSWRHLRAPMLAVTGSEADTWGPLPEPILAARLAHVPRLARATVPDAGHFPHMEQPGATAELLLDFLEP
jgi:pimeloyl-ACP methyl ester carboxylesterase